MELKRKLIKFITGTKASEEKQALDTWAADSKDNLAELNSILDMQKQSSLLHQYQEVDMKQAWSTIESKIGSDDVTKNYRKRWVSVAAIMVFVIGALFLFKTVSDLTVKQDTIVYNEASFNNIKLSDGSEIIKSPDAKVMQTSHRNITLEGSAYFDIKKDKNTPFKVQTNHGLVTVLGTEFNILTNKKFTTVYVTEGKVKVTYQGKEYFLTIYESIRIGGNMVKTFSSPVIKRDAWTNHILKFENQSLKTVLESVATYFHSELDWQTNTIDDQCKINTLFKDESLEEIMKELSLLTSLKYEIKNNKIVITAFKC